MKELKFISPLAVVLPRKTKKDKTIYLNLNVYRNLHYIINNQTKELYDEIMGDQLVGLKLKDPLSLLFVFYKKQNRRTDRSNTLSIVEKFFCDALVKHGCIDDDNDEVITSTHYFSGGIDKDNPRVEVFILPEIDLQGFKK